MTPIPLSTKRSASSQSGGGDARDVAARRAAAAATGGLSQQHPLAALVEAGGAHIDAYYYCPHHPEGHVKPYARPCACRKPGRALVDRAVEAFGIDPTRSFVIGDKWLDVAMARAIGGRGILVRTGCGAAEEQRPPAALTADAIVDNLIGAVGWVLRHV